MGLTTLFYLKNDFVNEIREEDPTKVVEYLCLGARSGGAESEGLRCGSASNAVRIVDSTHTGNRGLYFHRRGSVYIVDPHSPDLLEAMQRDPEEARKDIRYMRQIIDELESQLD